MQERKDEKLDNNLESETNAFIAVRLTINAVPYKLPGTREAQTQPNKQVREDTNLTIDNWPDKEDISYDSRHYLVEFTEMLSNLETIGDGQPRQNKAALHKIELSSAGARPIHSVPCVAGTKAQQLN